MDDEQEILLQLVETPEIFIAVAQAVGTGLQRQTQLREQFDPALVRAALLIHELRLRARGKFSRADQMWFDRTGLEQSTAEPIARHKAQRFAGYSEPVIDLCSGIGADSIALASAGLSVRSLDISQPAGLRTRLNAAVYGVADRIETISQDVEQAEIPHTLIQIDPDRRAGRNRAMKLEDYSPSLEFLHKLTGRTAGGAIKLSPASNFGGKFGDSEIELVSLHGECKEATVWYGALSGPVAMRATLLPSGETISGNPWEFRPDVGPLQQYLYDPDPAIVRSGLLDALVEREPVQRLDAAEEYLTGSTLIISPAWSAFEVLQNLPNNETDIRKAVRAAGYGELEIKSRHVPTNADAMRKKMGLNGTGRGTLIIARIDGRTRALLCRRVVQDLS